MSVNRQTVSWLTTCPPSDLNFRMNLDRATVEDIDDALLSPKLTKTARRLIESRRRSLARRLKPTRDVTARALGLGVLILLLAVAAQLYAQR